jgi:lipopolysaccharide cholinephosphotransferase
VSRLANEKKSSIVHFSNEYPAKMVVAFDRKLLEEAMRMPFEDTELSVPKEWDEVLRFYYGEGYMIPKRENYKTDLAGI